MSRTIAGYLLRPEDEQWILCCTKPSWLRPVIIWTIVSKKIQYEPSKEYLMLNLKWNLGLVSRIRKSIAKFDLKPDHVGFATIWFSGLAGDVSQNYPFLGQKILSSITNLRYSRIEARFKNWRKNILSTRSEFGDGCI